LVKTLFSRIQNGVMENAMSSGSMSSNSMSGQANRSHSSNHTMEGSFTRSGTTSNKPMAGRQAGPDPMGHINAVFGSRDSANDNTVIDGEYSRED
jgi:hypothetical protein